MATRAEKIQRAEQIIRSDPNVSKRSLQSRLVAEYGVGLSDTTRRGLLQRANTPSVLRARISTLAFMPRERTTLRKVLRRTGSTPYLAKAINDRFSRAKEARDAGLSQREFMRQAKAEAKEQGYIATKTTRTRGKPDGTVRGQIDWWKILRDYRDRDIERGEYIPKPKEKPRTDKGNIKAQKARYQDKQSTKAHSRWVEREKSRLSRWIEQKERAIAVSKGEQHRRLTQELSNLKRTRSTIR